MNFKKIGRIPNSWYLFAVLFSLGLFLFLYFNFVPIIDNFPIDYAGLLLHATSRKKEEIHPEFAMWYRNFVVSTRPIAVD